ncbi:MAG: hypothetical protein RLZZ561_893 [Pseudomonadota bacterium]|jgi:hypothetical protein
MAVRRIVLWIWLALAIGLGAVLIVLWSQREPLAKDAIDDFLAKRGVKASYEIKAIETRRQRLEKVRIGDPQHPDLTADWLEIDVGPSLSGFSIKAVRAGGVRLRARVIDKKISMGSVDRLLPPPSQEPFRLPRLDVALEDARAQLETPYGPIGLRLDGQGGLRAGFEGRLALTAPQIAALGCAARSVTVSGDVSVIGARPTFSGPIRFAKIGCTNLAGDAGDIQLDASISEDGRDWRGSARAALVRLTQGDLTARGGDATIEFSGDAQKTDAKFQLGLASLVGRDVAALQARADGDFVWRARGLDATGQARILRLMPGRQTREIAQQLRGLGGATPIGPVARQLATAVDGLSRGVTGQARFAASHRDGKFAVSLSDIGLLSASGAILRMPGKDVVTANPSGLFLNGMTRFGGGLFPSGRALFNGQSGTLNFQPYVADGARLTLAPTRISLGPQGVSLKTVATLDGPLGVGRVSGLSLPIRMEKGALWRGCLPIRYRALRIAQLRLSPAAMTACLGQRDVRLAPVRLVGVLDTSPIRFSAAGATYSLKNGHWRVLAPSARLLNGADVSGLTAAWVTGQSTPAGLSGDMAGLSGSLGGVPLSASQGAGRWRVTQAGLRFDGKMVIADRQAEPRFFPLLADAIQLRLTGTQMRGEALLREPKSGALVSTLALQHNLSDGRGSAQLGVEKLSFNDRLQPEAISPVTLGVIANVQGSLRGQGRIDWTPQGVTSSGRFSTDGLDFAAAFGPVTGLSGDINFTDLLGLVTSPGQQVRLASVNPGVLVSDGQVRYRILPGYKLQVDGGRWPFAGGALVLEPTILDMAQASDRRLTFAVEGLDAGRFIAAMQFENITATGTYDGHLPMIFDAAGGRIESGRLVARGGGTLSYVGDVSNGDLGLISRFAFDALKSMRYDRLSIDLNGAIDGDVITRISFAGVNQAPIEGGRTKLPIRILGASNLPFAFNVTITAKFRQLFDMARSFNDPSILINRLIPQLEPVPRSAPPEPKPVHPAESSPKP